MISYVLKVFLNCHYLCTIEQNFRFPFSLHYHCSANFKHRIVNQKMKSVTHYVYSFMLFQTFLSFVKNIKEHKRKETSSKQIVFFLYLSVWLVCYIPILVKPHNRYVWKTKIEVRCWKSSRCGYSQISFTCIRLEDHFVMPYSNTHKCEWHLRPMAEGKILSK